MKQENRQNMQNSGHQKPGLDSPWSGSYLWSQLILHLTIQEVIALHPGQQQFKGQLHGCLWVGVRTESKLTETKTKK